MLLAQLRAEKCSPDSNVNAHFALNPLRRAVWLIGRTELSELRQENVFGVEVIAWEGIVRLGYKAGILCALCGEMVVEAGPHSVPPNDVQKVGCLIKKLQIEKKTAHVGARCLPPETIPDSSTIHKLLPGASQPLSTTSDPDVTKVANFRLSSMTFQLLPPRLTEQSSQGFDPCEAATHSLLPAANATTPRKLKTLGHARTPNVRSRESMSLPREENCCHVSWAFMPCEGTGKM